MLNAAMTAACCISALCRLLELIAPVICLIGSSRFLVFRFETAPEISCRDAAIGPPRLAALEQAMVSWHFPEPELILDSHLETEVVDRQHVWAA
jgi:hypothetical protein